MNYIIITKNDTALKINCPPGPIGAPGIKVLIYVF